MSGVRGLRMLLAQAQDRARDDASLFNTGSYRKTKLKL